MKRILVTATTFPRWKNDPEPSFVYDLSKRLAKRYEVTVLVPHYPGAKEYEVIEGLKVHRFKYFIPKYERLCYDGGILPNLKKYPIARIQPPFLVAAETHAMKKLLKKNKYALIHAHWIIPQGWIAGKIGKKRKIPVITTAHAGDVFHSHSFFLKPFWKSAIRNATYCTVNSTYTGKILKSITTPKRMDIIPMGVDLAQFSPRKRDPKLKRHHHAEQLLLSVGRLAEKKGLTYLMKAMPLVLKQYPKAKLLIIGDGPEKERLIKETKELGVDRSVAFIGKMPNKELPKYYASADIFIGPSIVTKSGDTEGLGVVFLEALASGCAVIGSNVGGIPDIIKGGETGMLVPEQNPEALAKAIVLLLKDDALRAKTIAKGQKHIVAEYDWEKIAKRFSDMIEELT